MSAIEPKVLYPSGGYTPAYDERENGILLHPFVEPDRVLTPNLGEDAFRNNPKEAVGGFKGKDYLYAEFIVDTPEQVDPDTDIKVATVLRVASPSTLHWESVHIVFALREVPDGEGEDERPFKEFKPLEVKDAYKRDIDEGYSLLYFLVKDIRYPRAGQFRAEVRVQVTPGEQIFDLKGDDLERLGPKWKGHPGELQKLGHLAGGAVSKVVTEVNKGVELTPSDENRLRKYLEFEDKLKLVTEQELRKEMVDKHKYWHDNLVVT
ncbi:hypothetical protein B0H65DRAFT_586704 [Neurospora tetraspora]|uniref:Uncharacterized protein n=1 Tax=Neurospora tetraspora TaxID=94610 RepID=A0AAE0MVW6_9PEZI|nr:hypothetical protein B0H65DRAFT_586704 [Neurospora tetraspora]